MGKPRMEQSPKSGSGMRPRLFVTSESRPGLRSLDELRGAIRSGHAAALWEALLDKVRREAAQPPWTPESPLPERQDKHIRNRSREFELVGMTCGRILDAALAALVLDEQRYADAALAQIECLYDEVRWPELEDAAHLRDGDHCSLRRGQLALAIGLAYDWLHGFLAEEDRRRLVQGFDTRFTRAFRSGLDAPDAWTRTNNNYVTVIYGGFGIAGMSFAEDYPEAAWLTGTCTARMEQYAGGLFGPEGEFDESVQYAASVHGIVEYFTALRYATDGRENPFTQYPFADFCRWYMHMTFPPGRVAGFGDNRPDMPPTVAHAVAVAAALRDPVLQWFYLQYANTTLPTHRNRALELLQYDATLAAEPPDGELPLGRAYHAEARLVSSRSSWNPACCTSVVYAKAGRETNHGHPDWGQVCIDGYGERLIVDLGSTRGYPPAGHDPYYNYQQLGHNVLVFGDNETGGIPCDPLMSDRHPQGRIVRAEFDDRRGAAWTMDLTAPYGGSAEQVRRTVVHLLPDIAVVLDDATLPAADLIRLRWHTASPADPDDAGRFTVRGGQASLAARVMRLDGPAELSRGHHEYSAPYNRDRIGAVYPQRHEPYVEFRATDSSCRVLSLFAVFGPGDPPDTWQQSADGWHITTSSGKINITVAHDELHVCRNNEVIWRVPKT